MCGRTAALGILLNLLDSWVLGTVHMQTLVALLLVDIILGSWAVLMVLVSNPLALGTL